jgi:hypothetical protein
MLKLYSLKTVASARHYPSHANAQDHSIRLQASAEHNTGSKQMEGQRVEHSVVLGYCREDGVCRLRDGYVNFRYRKQQPM